jgi:hypothetical protein
VRSVVSSQAARAIQLARSRRREYARIIGRISRGQDGFA